MDAGQIAFAAAHRFQPGSAADREKFAPEAARLKLAEQKIQADAMAADDDEISRFQALPQRLYLDPRAGLNIFLLTRDNEEPVCTAKCRHGARSLAHRIGG